MAALGTLRRIKHQSRNPDQITTWMTRHALRLVQRSCNSIHEPIFAQRTPSGGATEGGEPGYPSRGCRARMLRVPPGMACIRFEIQECGARLRTSAVICMSKNKGPELINDSILVWAE